MALKQCKGMAMFYRYDVLKSIPCSVGRTSSIIVYKLPLLSTKDKSLNTVLVDFLIWFSVQRSLSMSSSHCTATLRDYVALHSHAHFQASGFQYLNRNIAFLFVTKNKNINLWDGQLGQGPTTQTSEKRRGYLCLNG